MKNYVLFKSDFGPTKNSIIPTFFPGQKIFKELSDDLEHYKYEIELKTLVSQPVGTLFIAKDYTVVNDSRQIFIKSEHVFPILSYQNDFVYPMVASDPEKQELIDFAIDGLIENVNYDNDDVKKWAEEFKAYGYTFDWDAKTAIKTGPGGTTNLKRSIGATYPCPKKEDIGFYIDPDQWARAVRNVITNENTLISGPTGCGKTEFLAHVAKAMGKDLSTVDMGTVLDASASLAGVHRLNSKGESEFDYAPFAQYIQKPGIILLDEVNRSTREANNYLFPCLDGRRYMPIDTAVHGGLRRIDVNDETVFFATANLGVEYSGTNQIDRALMDRFDVMEMDYPEESVEVDVICLRTQIDRKIAEAIVKLSNTIRKTHKKGELQTAVSVRHSLKTAGYVRDGFDMKQAIDWVMMPLFEDGDGQSDRQAVKALVTAF